MTKDEIAALKEEIRETENLASSPQTNDPTAARERLAELRRMLLQPTRRVITRPDALKEAKAIVAKSPDYRLTANKSNVSVWDTNRAHLHLFEGSSTSGYNHIVYSVRNSGQRTQAQIAAGEPIRYWVEKEENHHA
jgi:hypothetical protein